MSRCRDFDHHTRTDTSLAHRSLLFAFILSFFALPWLLSLLSRERSAVVGRAYVQHRNTTSGTSARTATWTSTEFV